MKRINRLFLLFILLIPMGGIAFLEGAVPQAERDALIALYYSTNGDHWNNKTNWLGGPGTENTWFGVTVGTINTEDHVTIISLVNNDLSGTIPAEISNLTQLKYLSLDHNHLSGDIPKELSNLSNLKRLVVDSNQLTGTIPAGIGALEKLESLGLNYNQLEGNIPGTLGNLRNLGKLRLGSNRLTGVIPTSLSRLGKLTSLEIDFNGLYTSDSGLKAFLDGKTPGWQDTQTTAPSIESVDILTDSSMEFKWTPIAFTTYDGYYEILYRTNLDPEGQYRSLGKTDSKSAVSIAIYNFNMIPGTAYYFVVRTKTFPHEYNPNSVLSNESPEYEFKTTAYTITVKSEPVEGAQIAVSPADIHGQNSGTASFTRTYAPGTGVTLTAPVTLNGAPFRMWEIIRSSENKAVYQPSITVIMEDDYTVTAVYKQPEIYFNPTYFNFGGTSDGVSTPAREFLIANRGGGTLDWAITADKPSWLTVTPESGSCTGRDSEFVTVAVDTSRLDEGSHESFIVITAADASNSPQELRVNLEVMDDSEDRPPFGSFETPLENSIVSSSIAVTGWALDDIGIEHVKIYREDFKEAPGELVYIGDAVFVEGARPDVEAAYPGYPMNYKAGWGYMMLTNAFQDRSKPPREFKIHAAAVDINENEVTLGVKTIIINNRDAVKPFGAIDTPVQGGKASGTLYRNRGWVLTPPANHPDDPQKIIPLDGSTIILYVDGKKQIEGAEYNIFRADIAMLFPGYENSEGAQAYFELDTTRFENGLHTISWTAEDNYGYRDGIGSRFFTVRNTGPGKAAAQMGPVVHHLPPAVGHADIKKIPVDTYDQPVEIRKGYNRDISPQIIYPDKNGGLNVEIKELERLEIHLSPSKEPCRYSGYLIGRDQLKPLPIGSTLDTIRGTFYWQPGPGFYGNYELLFLKEEMKDKEIRRIPVNIRILPGVETSRVIK